MGSLGSEYDGTNIVRGNSNADDGDTQPLEFDSQFPPFFDEENDNNFYELECLENAQPRDDTALASCAFETQRLNFDSEAQLLNATEETQVLDLAEETQRLDFESEVQLFNATEETEVLDLAEETQRLDFDSEAQLLNATEETQVMDFAEETQLLGNEGDFSGALETQLCEFDEEEAVGIRCIDEEDAVGTKVLTDVDSLADSDLSTRTSDKALGSKGMHPTSSLSQVEAESKQVGSTHSSVENVKCSSGSVKHGFTSICTASLRTSGLSARKKTAVKGLESGVVSNPIEVKSTELCDGAVNQESEVGRTNERIKRLSHESNTNLDSSMANKLDQENGDTGEHEHKDNTDEDTKGEDFSQMHICTDNLAGLSYVNSQEPGDSSQANALDFVDQFLKSSVCVLDLDTRKQDVAYKKANPLVISAKGTQKLAKKVNASCSLAEIGVYNWDASREDEGGGEFLSRNKEVLFCNISGARKSLTEPQKPKDIHRMQRRKRHKPINEEHQSIHVHDRLTGLAVSEPRSTAGRKMDQLEKMNIKRNLNSSFEKQICTGSTNIQLDPEEDDADMCETYDVGVDTQMAAEAIEALSNGVALPSYGENALLDEGCGGRWKDKMAHENAVKQNSVQKRVHPPNLGVTTRSKQTERTTDQVRDEAKFSVASQTRSKNVRKKVIKEKGSNQRYNTENITDLNEDGVHDERIFKVQDKVNKGPRERNLDDNGSTPAKKQRLEENIDIAAPIASRTRRNVLATVNTASELSVDPQMKAKDLRLVDADGSGRKICKSGSNAKEKDLKLTSRRDGIHSDDLAFSGGNVQSTSVQFSRNAKSKFLLEESVRLAEGQSITRQKRSKRRALSSKQVQPSLSSNENNACCSPSAQKAQPQCPTGPTQGTPKETETASFSACTTPVNCRTSIVTASPICMGDEYYKLSCKKNLESSSLMKELNSLSPSVPRCSLSNKGLRKRRDMASIRVLFSRHLGEDTIRHQKKILARLGVPAASSITDSTHFVADEFVRTRNMLEAIAHGKPVVNHLWLESCGQAGCYIDERNYILRDAKKEKELGFNMPVSLSHASQHPLLEDRRVLITPNTKPGVEILSSLVKAVHGQAFERICRSIYIDDKLRDDLLVLSCEEDYEFCMPLLEKGAEVYSSELLLNGIIIQKLELERHRLFIDHVKRTRSTIWLKKDGNEFHAVSRRV